MKTLYCKDCEQQLPASHFYKRTEIKKGYRLECKDCHRIRKSELKGWGIKKRIPKYNNGIKKECTMCHVVMPNRFFYTSTLKANNKTRHSSECKNCRGRRYRERYASNSEMKEKRIKIYNSTKGTLRYRVVKIYNSFKKTDLKKKRFNNLDKKFIKKTISYPCTYCGDTNKVSLDRIDNSFGHIKSNVVPCCKECNTARNINFTFEEMLIIGQSIKRIKEARSMVKLKKVS